MIADTAARLGWAMVDEVLDHHIQFSFRREKARINVYHTGSVTLNYMGKTETYHARHPGDVATIIESITSRIEAEKENLVAVKGGQGARLEKYVLAFIAGGAVDQNGTPSKVVEAAKRMMERVDAEGGKNA